MTKNDQTSLNQVGAPGAPDGDGPKEPGAASKKTFRLRVSLAPDDIGLLPIYEALANLPSDKARRLHLRQILIQSLMPAAAVASGASMNLATPFTRSAAGILAAPSTTQEFNPAATPPPGKVMRSAKEEKRKSLSKLVGLGLDD